MPMRTRSARPRWSPFLLSAAPLAATLVLTAGALGCRRSSAAEASRDEEPPIAIETTEASERPMPRSTHLTGKLVGTRETDLAANAIGRVLESRVERGAEVNAGQVLARLDTRAAALQASEARASLSALEARQKSASAECARAEQLVASGSISKAEYDRTRLACEISPADRQASEARAQLALLTVSDGLVRAPFGGYVTERYVRAGEYVRPDTRMYTLVDLSTVRLEVAVPEVLVGSLAAGRPLSFEVPAYPGRTFRGTLRATGRQIRPASRDVVADADVPNADHALLPGMFASVELPLEPSPSVVVPSSAVVERDGRARVFVIVSGHVHERVVEAGVEVDGLRAIARGVAPGEPVVVRPSPSIRNGIAAR